MADSFRLDPESHIYYLGDKKIPGVNEILGVFKKIKIRVKGEDYQFHVNTFNGVSIPSNVMSYCALSGTIIHDIAAKMIMGQPIGEQDEKMTKVAKQYEKFLRDFQVEPLLVEVCGHSAKHYYAGTMDLLCRVSGPYCEMYFGRSPVHCVLDIKSGKLSWSAGPQMAAYKNIVFENGLQPNGVRAEDVPRVVLLLPRNGTDYSFVPMNDPLDWPFFLIRRWEHNYLGNMKERTMKKGQSHEEGDEPA